MTHKGVKNVCDCGGHKTNTTHSLWCSVFAEPEEEITKDYNVNVIQKYIADYLKAQKKV